MSRKNGINKKACAAYHAYDIGHDVEGAAEVRLLVYATEHAETRPMMRFGIGRVLDFGGEQRLVTDGHWTQCAPYLEDIDPLRLYTAVVEQQKELAHFQAMWDERKKKEQPLLSCFDFARLVAATVTEPEQKPTPPLESVLKEPSRVPKPRKPRRKAQVDITADALAEVVVADALAAAAEDAAEAAPKAWTPDEIAAYFASQR